jgi:hypothetical protein
MPKYFFIKKKSFLKHRLVEESSNFFKEIFKEEIVIFVFCICCA